MAQLAADGVDVPALHRDRLISLVAERQDGVVVGRQLAALGLGRGAISHRVRRGLLQPLHRGIYLWAAGSATFAARARAAALAAGPAGGVLSRRTAAALWELGVEPGALIDVTRGGRAARIAGVRSHRAARLDRRDVRVVRGMAITSPERTLLDLAGELTARDLDAAVERAQLRRLVTASSLRAAIRRAPRHAGRGVLRELVEGRAFTRSQAERDLLALLRAARLPAPRLNVRVAGFEVDVLWPAQRVVLEFDSYAFHATRAAFERDRGRDAALLRAGFVVTRTTWRELQHDSHALVARVAELLATRPS